jgi:xanthine/uracil permease
VLVPAALQWLLFSLPLTILVPVVLGHMLGLTPRQTAVFIDQALVVTGAGGCLQVLLGHRLPLTEGQAGLWWAVFISLIASAQAFGHSGLWMMRNLEGGVAVAGAVVAALGLARLAGRVRAWFGPAVTGTFLVLLSIQISGTFVPGILGAGGGRPLRPETAALGLAVVALVLVLASAGRGLVRNFAVLIGMAAGWIAFAALGLAGPAGGGAALPPFAPPRLLPWGPAGFDAGVLVTCVVTGLVNLANVMGALVSMEYVLGRTFPARTYDRATAWTGAAHALAGGAGVIGTSPYAAAVGVIAVTGIGTRLPFLLGSALLGALGLFPHVGAVFATLPVAVGDAVTLVAFTQMLGFGLADLARLGLSQRSIYRVGFPMLIGTGLFVLPPATFAPVPATLRFLLANGTIVGTLLALALDRLVRWPDGRTEAGPP